MKLTVLGSGTMVPDKHHNPAGYIISSHKTNLLLDAGPGTMRRLTDYGFSLQTITAIVVSHFHTDHFSDVFSLVHTRWVDDIYHERPHTPLTIYGPIGIKKRWKLWRQIFWVEPEEHYPLTIIEVSGTKKVKVGDCQLVFFPVRHVEWFPSIGVTVLGEKKKVVYTGDIGGQHSEKQLIKTVAKSDLLIIEGAYLKETPNHYSFSQVKEVAKKAGVKKVLLVHINPTNYSQVLKKVKGEKTMIIAKDGMTLKI